MVKAAVFDERGQALGSAFETTRITSEKKGSAEIMSDCLTHLPLRVLARARSASKVASDEFAAISVTGARGTILPCVIKSWRTGPIFILMGVVCI